MTDSVTDRLEIKAGAGEPSLGELMSAFEAFKRDNDERLDEIEKKGSADPLVEEKLQRINSALDRLQAERSRPQLETGRTRIDDEYKDAFGAYVRHGETKALTIGSGPGGGYLVPGETETEITRLMTGLSPIRALATVRQVSATVYHKPVTITGPTAAWVNETDARTSATTSQTIDLLDFPTAELYAQPAATQVFIDDAAVDVGQWIADEVNAAFAAQETTAFVNGNGTNKPKGFLQETKIAEASWAWEKIGYIVTGVDGDFPASNKSDKLIDLVYTLKAGYRQNATWLMNRKTQAAVRKLKDADGNYLWQPAAVAGGKATLMGFDLVEAEDMPDIAEDSYSIAFGDFRRGYLIVDRAGVSVLRDPYSAKPYVLFYTTKRVGGGVQDFDAIKLLKFGES